MTPRTNAALVSTAALVVFSTACAYFGPPTGGAEFASGSGSCLDQAMIDNADDGDDQVMKLQGRGGYIYSYVDELGSTIEPSTESFDVTPGGVTDDGFALVIKGKIADGGGDLYAGVGIPFLDPMGEYDASVYSGVAFLARKGPGSSSSVRVKLPDANTDPAGKRCSECYNDFGIGFKLTEEWTRYVVDFDDLKQEQGWGDPRPESVDPSALFGIQFQVATPSAEFEIWLDEITFVGCP